MFHLHRTIRVLALCVALAGCAGVHRGAASLAPAGEPACRTAIGGDRSGAAPPIAWQFADIAHRAELDAWCGVVGPAVIDATSLPIADDDVPMSSVAIVSWNVHVGNGDLPGFVAALRRGEFTGGTPVPHFVLLLQEAVRTGAAVPARRAGRDVASERIAAGSPMPDIVEAARAMRLAVYYAPSMRNGRTAPDEAGEDRGNAILSSLPLSDFSAVELPFERQRRVAISATLHGRDDAGGWQLRVTSAHLNATAGARRLWMFASDLRARQARGLLSSMPPGEPAIIGSDMNTWAGGSREPAVAVVNRLFPDAAAVGSFATGDLGRRLDYLFFRLPDGWRGAYDRLDARFGSDHYPLLGWLHVPESR